MHRYARSLVATIAFTRPVGAVGAAQVVDAPPLTLRAAVESARQRNPDIITARLRVDSAHGEHRIATALPNPLFTATPANPSQYAVQMPVDVTPARYFRTRVSSQALDAAELDVLDVERQVVFAVRQAFYDILLADSLHALVGTQAETFRRLLQADSVRLRNGSIAERDVVTTRLQLTHADALLSRAAVQQHAARLTLGQMLGMLGADTTLRISGTLSYDPVAVTPDSIVTLALAHRPDGRAAAVRVEQSRSALSLARAALVPVPLVGGVYQPAQAFASGSHLAASVGLTIPILYLFGGERARARASLEAARVLLGRAQLQIHSDVTESVDAYLSARALADRYACGLLGDASRALDDARYAYDRGAVGLPDLLEAIRAYSDTRADYLTAVHDYWVSLFALERAAGVDFLPVGP